MFASPLVTQLPNGIRAETLIDYREEFKWVENNSFAKVIIFKKLCATQLNTLKLKEF